MITKQSHKIIISAGCFVLLIISWIIAVNTKSTAEKQHELIIQAAALMNDGIYIRAIPLLEEAAEYNSAYTQTAETDLKKAYTAIINHRGIRHRYTALLDKQMSRKDAHPDVFIEAAEYYLKTSKIAEALDILKDGIKKTGSAQIIELYEKERYVYETDRSNYSDVTAISGQTIQVQADGAWGIALANGELLIPCEYEKISTYNNGRAIVKKAGEIYAIDGDNNRTALLREPVYDFGNYYNDRIPVLMNDGWRRATGEFIIGTTVFEGLGMYNGGHAAAKENGKWGIIDLDAKWIIPAEYDEIIMDELGRCFAQGAVFVRQSGSVYLYKGGKRTDGIYDDARPFSDEGYAAVKRNGRWGFVDTGGNEVIDFIYDDALSFGQHLAAVRQGDKWGYISLYGHMVIEPVFNKAGSFSDGSAPVMTDSGWQFITLLEYKKGVGL